MHFLAMGAAPSTTILIEIEVSGLVFHSQGQQKLTTLGPQLSTCLI